MTIRPFIPSSRMTRRGRELRNAVVLSFARETEWAACSLAQFTEREWKANLAWLDISGLALYFLDRLFELGCEHVLPQVILNRLLQNLVDNSARNAALLDEASAINRGLAAEGVLFANLKGITLTPHSVPDPALRFQLDLDFLVDEDDASVAARVLEQMGYERVSVSGETWEFKAANFSMPSLDDFYKKKPQRVAEIHLSSREGPLERVQNRTFAGVEIAALSPADLYLQQAVHLFKHLRSSYTRASWVLEYRRHMLARHAENDFWKGLEVLTANEPEARVALGVVTLLVVEVFGDTPNEFLAGLIATYLAPSIQLWVKLYGQSALVANFPGTKLYLLLQAEFDVTSMRRRSALLPLSLPPRLLSRSHNESFRSKLRRLHIQIDFILFRLRFHCVEGGRYLLEAIRFRRRVAGLPVGLES